MSLTANFTYALNWTAPSFVDWDLSSCTAVSSVMSYLVLNDPPNSNESFWTAIPMYIAIDFADSVLPDGWPEPPAGAALDWFYNIPAYYMLESEEDFVTILDALLNFTMESCTPELCQDLNWDGDADLSGIGMMISYYMVAIMATVYYIVLVPGLFEAFGRPFPWNGKLYSKVVAGFEESLQGFLDAMLLFAISMTIAAITRYVHVVQHPDDTRNFYQMLDCIFLASFSVFPAFVLQSLSHELRRRRIRLGMWFLLLVFTITLDVLYNKEYLDLFKSEDALEGILTSDATGQLAQTVWLTTCQSLNLFASLMSCLLAGHIIMVANCSWWVYYVAASLGGGKRLRPAFEAHTRLWRVWGMLRLALRVGNGLLCLSIMWVFLALFTSYRSDVAARAGESDGDDEWTFGQVLGLVTWVPVLVDLVVVYLYGASESHEGHMSHKYKVVAKSEADLIRDQIRYQEASMDEKNAAVKEAFVGYQGGEQQQQQQSQHQQQQASYMHHHQDTWLDA